MSPLPYKPKPGEIPTDPGVYRFRDADGRVLYVGKAKNLRARLSNYFAPLHTLHERTRRMVTTASSVEWTVVATDVDSLQLEYMWIKEFDPPFNVKYRDDKSYPFMAITLADEAPRVIVTRNRRIKGAKYFGPYPKVWAVHDTIDQLIKVFPIRTCSDSSYKKAMATGRPCFPGQIGRCGGPCSMRVTVDEHRAIVQDFVAFMSGGDQRFARELTARMREASAAMDYEAAAVYRDQLGAIEAVLGKSALVLTEDTDADLFGIAEDELAATVQHFVVRGGRVRGVHATTIEKELDISGADLVEQVLQRTYGDRGLTVVGFPCNQFLGQEPGSMEQILDYCATTWGVSFPVNDKIKVNGRGAAPLYAALKSAKDGNGKAGAVKWNFEKFLVTPDGSVHRFRPTTSPDDPEILRLIEQHLTS